MVLVVARVILIMICLANLGGMLVIEPAIA